MIAALVVGTLAAAAGVLLWLDRAERDRTVQDALAKADRVKIEFFKSGSYASVTGELVLKDKPLFAPLTGRACAAYEVLVERLIETKAGERWLKVVHEWDIQSFAVDDGTGRAYVDSKGAMVSIVGDHRTMTGEFGEPDERHLAFVEKQDARVFALIGEDSTLRYREGVLEVGERVAVIGRGRVSADDMTADGPYRGAPRVRVDFQAQWRAPLYVTDDI